MGQSLIYIDKTNIDKTEDRPVSGTKAQVAELVDALVSGTSDASRGGSSPLLGTIVSKKIQFSSGTDTRQPFVV